MTIQNVPPESGLQRVYNQAHAARQPAPEAVRGRRAEDQIELSDEARARAAASPVENATGLSPARVASLRAWIAAEGYKDPQVREQVARRMLGLGEV